jgi:hypothetical protein
MDSAVFSTTLSGAVAIVVAALTAGSTYLLTKKREREADWRKVKLELYREFVEAVAGITEGRMTPESETRYHDAFNRLVSWHHQPCWQPFRLFKGKYLRRMLPGLKQHTTKNTAP